jgi:Ca2+-binding EF-hand superfamily protein
MRSGAKNPGRGAAKRTLERPGLTSDEIEELREAFNLFDTEATGKIDPKYLYLHLQGTQVSHADLGV